MKAITCWNKNGKFNHISDGWCRNSTPLAISEEQEQHWRNQSWEKEYGLLINKHVVRNFKDIIYIFRKV